VACDLVCSDWSTHAAILGLPLIAKGLHECLALGLLIVMSGILSVGTVGHNELRLHLRHNCQRPALRVFEEGHPFLCPICMFVDHVRCVNKFNTAQSQIVVSLYDVFDQQVQNRLG
jgi:hypothetical protein